MQKKSRKQYNAEYDESVTVATIAERMFVHLRITKDLRDSFINLDGVRFRRMQEGK